MWQAERLFWWLTNEADSIKPNKTAKNHRQPLVGKAAGWQKTSRLSRQKSLKVKLKELLAGFLNFSWALKRKDWVSSLVELCSPAATMPQQCLPYLGRQSGATEHTVLLQDIFRSVDGWMDGSSAGLAFWPLGFSSVPSHKGGKKTLLACEVFRHHFEGFVCFLTPPEPTFLSKCSQK